MRQENPRFRNFRPAGLLLAIHALAASVVATPDRPAAEYGARVPFQTVEAENPANRVRGERVRLTTPPKAKDWTPAIEASGRAYVELRAAGDYLELKLDRAANTLVLRHCIPDAETGGGIEATLSLYVNGVFRQKLRLSSKFNWLYGSPGQNGQSNQPDAGSPHAFWDETPFQLTTEVAPGDILRLQEDADDTAAFYRLDLLDLEKAPAALAPPPAGTYLSVADFGARGDGQADDTAAIQQCIDAAAEQHKTVWLPAGTYQQTAKWRVTGVAVQGAGMWHTRIVGIKPGDTWSGNIGFELAGTGAAVRDLMIAGKAVTTRKPGALGAGQCFIGHPDQWTVENVWITHTNTGFWMGGATCGVIRNCRVRFTYADAINLNNGVSDTLVENCHVRGAGDDGLAILSESRVSVRSQNITLRHNTVSANWWGHNCDIAGGRGHLVEGNLLADSGLMGGLALNLPASYPMQELTGSVIRGNRLLRCGGNFAGQKRGALWIFAQSNSVSGVIFADNEIANSLFSGIHLHAPRFSSVIDSPSVIVTFQNNRILQSGTEGVRIESGLQGQLTFTDNRVAGSPSAVPPFAGSSEPGLTLLEERNSWQK